MSYQYKKSSILHELEQAIKRKVVEKPKAKEQYHKNLQASVDKKKNHRQSIERLSKPKQTYQKDAQGATKGGKVMSLFNNENLMNVATTEHTKPTHEAKKLNHRKLDKLISLINYALSSADKTIRYINTGNFEAQFAVKLFKSDRENLLNQIKSLNLEELLESGREGSKIATPNLYIVQQENFKLKKELAVIEKQLERSMRKNPPSEIQSLLTEKEMQIEKYKETLYRLKGPDFCEKVSTIIEKQMKYEGISRKQGQQSYEFDSILRSLSGERNSLCRQMVESKEMKKYSNEWAQVKAFIEKKLKTDPSSDEKPIQALRKYYDRTLSQEGESNKNSRRFTSEEEKINHIRQEKQQLMIEIQKCKKQIGEISTLTEMKSILDEVKEQNKRLLADTYNLLPQKIQQDLSLKPENEALIVTRMKEVMEDYFELQAQFKNLIEKAQESQTELSKLKQKIENSNGASDGNSHKLEEQIQYLTNQLEQKDHKIHQNQQSLNKLTKKLEQANKRVNQLQISKQQEINQVFEQFENARSQLEEKESLLDDKETQILQLQVQVKRIEEQLERLRENKRENSREKEIEAQKARESKSILLKCQEQLEQYKKILMTKDDELNRLTFEYEMMQDGKNKESSSNVEQEEKIRKMTSELKEIKNDNENLKKENKENVGVIIEYEEELEDRDYRIKQLLAENQENKKENQILSNKICQIQRSQLTKSHDSYQSLKNSPEKHKIEEQLRRQLERAYKKNEKNYEEKIEELSYKISSSISESNEKEIKIKDINEQMMEKTKKNQELEKRLSQIQLQIEKNECERAMKENNQKIQFECEIQQKQIEIKELKEKLAQLESRTENLKQREGEVKEQQRQILLNQSLLEEEKKSIHLKVEEIEQREMEVEKNMLIMLEKEEDLNERMRKSAEDIEVLTEKEIQLKRLEEKLRNEEQIMSLKEIKVSSETEKLQEDLLKKQSEMKEREEKHKHQLEEISHQLKETYSKEREKLEISKNQLNQWWEEKFNNLEKSFQKKLVEEVEEKEKFINEIEKYQKQIQTKNNELNDKDGLLRKSEDLEKQVQKLRNDRQNISKEKQEVQFEVTSLKQENSFLKEENIQLSVEISAQRQTLSRFEEEQNDMSELCDQKSKIIEELQKIIESLEQKIEEDQRLKENGKKEQNGQKMASISELQQKIEESEENIKQLRKWKNISLMKEKQYCNLIKRILRGCIDLDEIGDTDAMSLGTLLELGSQKVMEVRMRVREEESNQKRILKQQDEHGDEENNQTEGFHLEGREDDDERSELQSQVQQFVVPSSTTSLEQNGSIQNPYNNELNSRENTQQAGDKEEKMENSFQEEDKEKDFDEFAQIEAGVNDSMISSDQNEKQSPQDECSNQESISNEEKKQNEIQIQNKNEEKQMEGQNIYSIQQSPNKEEICKQLEDFNDLESQKMNDSMISNDNEVNQPPKESEHQGAQQKSHETHSKNQSYCQEHKNQGLNFSQFEEKNVSSELGASIISEQGQEQQQGAIFIEKRDTEGDQDQKKSLQVEDKTSSCHKDEEIVAIFPVFQNINDDQVDISSIHHQQNHHEENNGFHQLQNFLQFENHEQNLDSSMGSQNQKQEDSAKKQSQMQIKGEEEIEIEKDLNDFDQFESGQLSQSMISQSQIQDNQRKLQVLEKPPQIHKDHQQRVEPETVNGENNHEKLKKDSENSFGDFDDFQSEKLSESMVSQKQQEEEKTEEKKNMTAKSEQSVTDKDIKDLNDFADFTSEKMSDSMISEGYAQDNDVKQEEKDGDEINFDEFDEMKSEKMSESMLSDQ